jgi:hypothetical protein
MLCLALKEGRVSDGDRGEVEEHLELRLGFDKEDREPLLPTERE